MINRFCDFLAKDKAAHELIREVIGSSIVTRQETLNRFLDYLRGDGNIKGLDTLDLNALFHFIFAGKHLLVIPRACFGNNDVLVLKNFHGQLHFEPELIEFSNDRFFVNPNVYLPGYLRQCLKQAYHE